MKRNISLVVTSIAEPNKVLTELAAGCKEKNLYFIVIGDKKSPSGFNLSGCDFFSLERQLQTGFKYPELCPTGHYARKNIGYLLAIRKNADIIIETDDDNLPYQSFWDERESTKWVATLKNAGWVNVYRYFSDTVIWPRGLPLDSIHSPLPDFENIEKENLFCPVQQGLADENPDVDALYRLILPLPQTFNKGRHIALSSGSWCSFNSQNTTWFKEAFPLLYLPSYCSFRMTDIWRSFIAQRIAWENNWGILFHQATVWQERNAHNLMRDFKDEIPGYLENKRICEALESVDLKSGVDNISENLLICYDKLVSISVIEKREMPLLNSWIEDIKMIF